MSVTASKEYRSQPHLILYGALAVFLGFDALFSGVVIFALWEIALLADGGDLRYPLWGAIQQVYVPLTAVWLLLLGVWFARLARWSRASTTEKRHTTAAVAAFLHRLPRLTGAVWSLKLVLLLMAVLSKVAVLSDAASAMLLITMLVGGWPFASALTSWLCAPLARDLDRFQVSEDLPPIPRSKRLGQGLVAYVVALALGSSCYLATLAFVAVDLQMTHDQVAGAAAAFMLGCVVFAVSVALTIAAMMTEPIIQITRSIRQILSGGPIEDVDRIMSGRVDELGVLSDVTNRLIQRLQDVEHEHSAALSALKALNEGLEDRVRSRTEALETANAELARVFEQQMRMERELRLAQKLEAVGQLGAGIAHEINTPMQYIGDHAAFLRRACDQLETAVGEFERLLSEGSSTEAERMALVDRLRRVRECAPTALDGIDVGVQKVAEIVGAMQRFSRGVHDEQGYSDLNESLRATLTISRNEWRGVARVRTTLCPDIPPLPCFVGELNQALLNLIMNATQAIEEASKGDGALGEIHIQTSLQDGVVEARIADTGGGIPVEIQDRIFDPFYTTRAVGDGRGQGLSTTRNIIVDKHGGSLDFQTSPSGTTFIVRLPLVQRAMAAA